MTSSTLDLERYIPALLTFASNRLSHGASEIYRRLFGVGITEWRVISMLAREPDISAARICQVVGFDKGLASRVIKKLSADGLVNVSPDSIPGNRSLLRLTAEGEALHDKVLRVVRERERILHEPFTEAEIETLISLLHRLHAQAEIVNAYRPEPNAPKRRRGERSRTE
ncbi:MarR family winged helix-turn-helix transcriptional regulator [Phenylobacterium sp. VNQ135]|uniref:MarR family winged helix-turn-helix transcriptional regulator n=1 Tax=Phenylobacterium sp. VNQ135 TaxID=3400922 RepID=UPI003C2BEC21